MFAALDILIVLTGRAQRHRVDFKKEWKRFDSFPRGRVCVFFSTTAYAQAAEISRVGGLPVGGGFHTDQLRRAHGGV